MARAASRRKRDPVDGLVELSGDTGGPLTPLSPAWVFEPPAVTAGVVGARTIGPLRDLIAVSALRVPRDASQRWDGLVSPGTDVDRANLWWTPPEPDGAARRRSAPRLAP